MNTRKMNTRITIFEKIGGQNEDGEVIDGIRKDVYSCWAEVSKTSIKDFKAANKTSTDSQNSLESVQDIKVFLIRYLPNIPFDNSMYLEFNGFEYRIVEIEIDYASKEIIMIKPVRIS